jgi:hypothetical protein
VINKLIKNKFEGITSGPGGAEPAAAIVLYAHSSSSSAPEIELARGNIIVGNDIGIHWKGPTLIGPDRNGKITDFGNKDEDGENTFACNATLSGSTPGGDLVFDIDAAAGAAPMAFMGNQWDHVAPHAAAKVAPNGQDIAFSGSAAANVIQTGNDKPAPACVAPYIAGP